jgi:hypothetical protein
MTTASITHRPVPLATAAAAAVAVLAFGAVTLQHDAGSPSPGGPTQSHQTGQTGQHPDRFQPRGGGKVKLGLP